MHALLRHLEDAGFAAAPRLVGSGLDTDGREMVTFIDGEFTQPGPWSLDGAAAVGRMLRDLHRATRSFRPPPNAEWFPWHGRDLGDVRRAGQAILDGLGADEKDQLRPRILFSDVIEDVTDAHAIIINRNRSGSMIIPGDTLGVSEVTPALFAAVAANEAERAAPGVTLVDVSMIGAAGRIYLSGPAAEVRHGQREITEVLAAVAGRDQ